MAVIERSQVAHLPPFAGATSCQIDAALELAHPVYRPKGTRLFEQDGTADSFFVLLHGRLRVTKLTTDGQQVVVRFAVPGELIGVAQVLGRATYPATATAAVDSIALAWPSSTWGDLLATLPSLAATALQMVGARLQDAHGRIVELSTEQVEQRIANILVRLSRSTGRRIDQGIEIDFPISRRDVAEATGTTLHNVSRILSAWEERGWVIGGRQKIIVREPHKLLAVMGRPSEQGPLRS
jgi:CRP-like cAMP-binding protein